MSQWFLRFFHSLSVTTWITLLAFILFFWLLAFGHHGLYELEQLLRIKNNLLFEKEALVSEKKALNSELKHLEDPIYLKYLIHKEMGFTQPDEVIIQLQKKR